MMMGKKECKVEYAYQTVRLLKENGLDIVACVTPYFNIQNPKHFN